MFDHLAIPDELERNAAVFQSLLAGKTEAARLRRPAPEKWNLLEIVSHLLDEEREDFGARTLHALESPGEPAPRIDPVGWVTQRNYAAQDYETVLAQFLEERRVSVAWLRALEAPNWDSSFQHPDLGAMSAHSLLCNWLAHDYLHIRQINRYGWEFLKQTSGEELDYAGDW